MDKVINLPPDLGAILYGIRKNAYVIVNEAEDDYTIVDPAIVAISAWQEESKSHYCLERTVSFDNEEVSRHLIRLPNKLSKSELWRYASILFYLPLVNEININFAYLVATQQNSGNILSEWIDPYLIGEILKRRNNPFEY